MSRTHPRFAACRILVYHELFHTKVTPYRFRNISFPRSLFFAYSFDLTVQHTRILQTSTRLDQQEITNWTRTPFSRNKYETSVPGKKKKKRANAARPSRKNKTATSRTATSRALTGCLSILISCTKNGLKRCSMLPDQALNRFHSAARHIAVHFLQTSTHERQSLNIFKQTVPLLMFQEFFMPTDRQICQSGSMILKNMFVHFLWD